MERRLGEIILAGVVHGDPKGYDKLTRLFQRSKPRLISVEISEYSWRYRRRRQARWQRQFQLACQALPPEMRRHLALQKVAAQIAYPFEVTAAEDYAREHGAAWRAVDLNRIAREHLPRYETELLHPENLRRLVLTEDGDWQEYIRQEYRRARRGLQAGRDREFKPKGCALLPQRTLREKVLARRVARLAKAWSKIVHVGGWEHLIRSEENTNLISVPQSSTKTMADFLAVLRPEIVLLDEGSAEFE
jgi:hypothetical protein